MNLVANAKLKVTKNLLNLKYKSIHKLTKDDQKIRVSVQGVKSLGGHFACLCRGFDIYEVIFFSLFFFKKRREILLHF